MNVSGKRVTVLGAGKSGIAAAELLLIKGAEVLVSELGKIDEAGRLSLHEKRIPYEENDHSEKVYDADFCVVSPGIPPSAPVIKNMQARGIGLFSEIEIASLYCRARIVGITGTDGKTTTSTLVHRICEADGERSGYRSYCVGNIGVPFSSKVLEMTSRDIAVVELSSYQLERCFSFRPDVAVITNITPDHLDRYEGDIRRYAQAKYRIYANQGPDDTLVFNADDPMLREQFTDMRSNYPFRVTPFGIDCRPEGMMGHSFVFLDKDSISVQSESGNERIIETGEFLKNSFRGRHNIYNVLAAVAVSKALSIDNGALRSTLREFTGVEHRQEFVATVDGTGWVNDSKATNLNAMRQALEAQSGRVVLIAGGRDKGNDYSSIAGLVGRKVSLLVAIGESKEKIVTAFRGIVDVKTAETLEDAVSISREAAESGQTVLFSPGCSSFDMFENFEDRGRQFKQCVQHLQPC
ncbi:MAG: UDP-N-acetylmuramoyl-L-alanine--D-glutamate ligase [Chlorobiaceae bacterium]|jgi:UDP-N-acetylmuramoylalanine--D-glutamate ligase|nr:UDP-N-acetylmuramoyl-L-alanine--D-glutamate ligase [Chlorobiaceae bacterium]